MSRIVIFTSGTLGDHLPFIALGQALQNRGQSVCLALNPAMQNYAQRAGLESAALTDHLRGPEEARQNAWAWNHWRDPRTHPGAGPFDANQFATQCAELIELSRDADLLITTSIRTHGYVVHSATGLPWLTISMNPFHFWLPPTPDERRARREQQLTSVPFFKELLAYTFAELGIQKLIPPYSPAWLWGSRVLLASSPHFSRPNLNQLQPQATLEMTGFWYYQDPDWENWQPDPALASFMERRPLALAFSSQPLEAPGEILARHARVATRLGLPLLVQRGWAGFSEDGLPAECDPSQVFFADFLPHDWLFARVAAAIQHGGIGSMARALRQGCPLLVEPFGNDQLYNASRAAELGVAAALHPFNATVDELVKALAERVLIPETRQRAAALGSLLRAEDGLGVACQIIEGHLQQAGGQRPFAWRAPLRKIDASAGRSPMAGSLEEASSMMTPIPKILHQTWKDTQLPAELAEFQRTWLEKHPGWTYNLWTDADNRQFIRQHYVWFLPIYDGYPEHIMRVDAVRYFILHHFGGVYVDLDFECLQSVEPLLQDHALVFGLEPQAHLEMRQRAGYPLDRIVCNAFMASTPGHPFWEYVFKQLISYHRAPEVLDATGPFMLSRACATFVQPEAIYTAPPELLYPIEKERPWGQLTDAEQEHIRQTAFAIHHWMGSYWKLVAQTRRQPVSATLLSRGNTVSRAVINLETCLAELYQKPSLPRISALMVTRDRPALAIGSIQCFQRQTYPNKELIIVDDGPDDRLQRWVESTHDECLHFVHLPADGQTLGELRNLAVARASGDYVAQWDDDDLSAPNRLEIQMALIHLLDAEACLLARHQIWWPALRRAAISDQRYWESSFVCRREALPAYPALRQGEDTPVIEQLIAQQRVAILDFPRLYTYISHGNNTFATGHWEAHWRFATASYENDHYDIWLRQFQEQVGVDLSPWLDAALEPAAQASRSHPQPPPPAKAQVLASAPPAAGLPPRILILTPVKDAMRYLPAFLEKLRTLAFPHDYISLAFLESDSQDGTSTYLAGELSGLCQEFSRAELFRRDFGLRLESKRWESSTQYERRATLARSRNYLLAQALHDEAWVLWVDADLARFPPDIIEQLLASGKDIVTPNCLALGTNRSFDLNTFKLAPGAEKLDWRPYIVDGILQPPPGFGRLYLSDLRAYDAVTLDGVGATMLLVRADIHREGLVFPTFSYHGFIETEGLALMARHMGYHCWGLPKVEIFHPAA